MLTIAFHPLGLGHPLLDTLEEHVLPLVDVKPSRVVGFAFIFRVELLRIEAGNSARGAV